MNIIIILQINDNFIITNKNIISNFNMYSSIGAVSKLFGLQHQISKQDVAYKNKF